MKIYHWPHNCTDYICDNYEKHSDVLEIKRLNFFIGKNNTGKSRFLRALFLTPYDIHHNIFLYHSESIPDLIKILPSYYFYDVDKFLDVLRRSMDKNPLIIQKEIRGIIEEIITFLEGRSRYTEVQEFKDIVYTNGKILERFEKNIGNYYIPTLRGMRPCVSQKHAYIERTQKDYFKDNNNIITGESLYNELTAHLLGEPEQRDLIKDYEQKLSQYFFENQKITLIPKYKSDVVHIKIGDDKQFPIYKLGDGLQQVITLTYEPFIKHKEVHSFFIEEPELNMHAGMVRQLMNFFLNETRHYYYFTTHSNHLLDMADESSEVMIQKFIKEDNTFKIYRCNRDHDLIGSLGVRPSSVYLANCTIWVEGITDRLYFTKYLEQYLKLLQSSNPTLYQAYRRFMPNYHYTFVEYAGSNLTHWSFDCDLASHEQDKGLSAKAITSDMLLIADGDLRDKSDQVAKLQQELNNKLFILECKETENTLPPEAIKYVARQRFQKMRPQTKVGYTIDQLDHIATSDYFFHPNQGIGRLLELQIQNDQTEKPNHPFAHGNGVGTIKDKLHFCRDIIQYFSENPDWQLTPEAQKICQRIFEHIEQCNR